jgi:hypothetical protein
MRIVWPPSEEREPSPERAKLVYGYMLLIAVTLLVLTTGSDSVLEKLITVMILGLLVANRPSGKTGGQ